MTIRLWRFVLLHVAAGDLRDGHVADARESVNLQGAEPVPRVRRATPPGPLLLDHPLGGLGEGGDAHQPKLLGERIAARAGELLVGQRLLAGLGHRDQFDAAASKLALAAPNHEALNPTPDPGLLDVEVESVSVAVPTGRSGAHEGRHAAGWSHTRETEMAIEPARSAATPGARWYQVRIALCRPGSWWAIRSRYGLPPVPGNGACNSKNGDRSQEWLIATLKREGVIG